MWQVDVPLGEFYNSIVAAGKRAGYLAVITALVREADSGAFYDDISRYWDSLHDVTGPDVLFVLAGPSASAKVQDHGVADGHEPIAYSSESAAVVQTSQRPLGPNLSHWAARAGTSVAPRASDIAGPQTRAVFQLRRQLGVPESGVPCLHITFLGPRRCNESVTIPLSSRTVYDTVKHIVSCFDEGFQTIRRLTTRLDQLEHTPLRKRRKLSYYLVLGDKSPEQIEAARAIVAACAAAASTPDAIAAARQDCFRRLRVLKGTSDFPSLQQHIDIHLNWQAITKQNETERQKAATGSALAAAWDAVFRAAGDVASLPMSSDLRYRIFIAYQSDNRWIAEHLHSALARNTLTFLDVRCLRPGDRWVQQIRSAQDSAEITILLVGESGATSWFQQAEYLRAIELARANRQRLVPVYICGSPEPAPYGLEGVQGIVTTWASGIRHDEVRKVAAEITALLPNR